MIQKERGKKELFPRYILGLDISTTCIGVCVVKDDGISNKPEILYLSHKTPKVSEKGIESLFIKKKIFEEEFIKDINSNFTITDVVIEEPLLSSNNVNTVATLLRFNGMISDAVYENLGVVPNFISSYDARAYSFPDLLSIRKYNKKGETYSLKHLTNAIKNKKLVLFGSYPYDIDKKSVMMNYVNELYNDSPINWVKNNKNELKKENYDACDALICALAYININHYGLEKPDISNYKIEKDGITYTTKIWDKTYNKKIVI